MKRSALCVLLLASLFVFVSAAHPANTLRASHGGQDHVGFGDTISVAEGETAGDIVCAFCTVRIGGNVSGDVVTFFGNIEVADGRAISGDVVAFGGSLKLANEARIGGDLVVFGADLEQAPSASIRQDHVIFSGGGWLLVALLPFLLPIGVVWLVVHLIRRSRYRFPAYPGGRRY